MKPTWKDISLPVTEKILTWPTDPVFHFHYFASFEMGKPCLASEISLSVHTGTHIDAPAHFIKEGDTMSKWEPEITIGKCRVIQIEDPKEITAEEVSKHNIQIGERILFRTKNSDSHWWENKFNPAFVSISPKAAALLAKLKPLCIGIDYLSVGSPETGVETHLHLLGAKIWLIESLDLTKISPGNYELIFMPVNLYNAEAAPGRAILREQ
jgi:arylformamidase